VSENYGLPIDPKRLVHSMSVGERQRVEIVRCLLQNPKLLIMDEPTSVLTPQAVLKLFETLRRLATEGCSILYISHKLDEIQSLCDSATFCGAGAWRPSGAQARDTGEPGAPDDRLGPAGDVICSRAPGEQRLAVERLSCHAGSLRCQPARGEPASAQR
jgi:simple sugar transport system ATP-binding protein